MPVIAKRDNMPITDRSVPGMPKIIYVNQRRVDSSNVEWIGWPTSGEPLMLVGYKNGGIYGYLGVSRQRAVAAANHGSCGIYINDRIKPKFEAVKIE